MGLLSAAAKAGKAIIPMMESWGPATKAAAGVAAVGGAVDLGGMTVGKMVSGAYDAMTADERLDSDMTGLVAMQRLLRARQEREQRLQRKMAENEAALAASNPTLYNNVLAGRKLPRGAVRIGGQPRRDLMERLTRLMAEGQFGGTQETEYGG